MTRRSPRLALSLGALAVAATCGALTLVFLRPSTLSEVVGVEAPGRAAIDYLGFLLFPVVGTVVAWKRPENAVGWMLLAYAVIGGLVSLNYEYAIRGVLLEPGSLPAAGLAAWVDVWLWLVQLSLIPLVFLHFPTGRLPSPAWRWARWSAALPAALLAVPVVAHVGVPAKELLLLGEEEAIPGLEWTGPLVVGALGALIVLMLVSVGSLFVRYRRSRQEERQQLKWVLVAASVLIIDGIWDVYLPGPETLKDVVAALAFAGIPLSMGVAILKYRLYDIDAIINRALVYGTLSILLALVYAAGVFVVGGALRSLAGAQDNRLAVAGSTLAVAAFFRPARSRIQDFIDRRFYRSRYDAAKTLEAFSARLREEVDLDELVADLVAVVQNTIRPTHASVWLAPAVKAADRRPSVASGR